MVNRCPVCEGSMYYDTCKDCGHRVDDSYSRRSGGAGSLRQPLSDEDYREEMRKLMR